MEEPRDKFGPENLSVLWSDISGTINEKTGEICFTKTYRYDGHKVDYCGKLDLSGSSVPLGVWHIKDYTGTWSINRS